MFSDTVVIFLPLFRDEQHGFAKAAESLWAALMSVANLMLISLAAGTPLRAGIDVGNGLDVSDNEVYGPVLVRAYRLESKIAEYPRAVIGDGLLRYLRFLEQQANDPTPWTGHAAERAAACKKLICTDPAGVHMLHILAPEVLASGPNHRELPPKALHWITQELAIHEAAHDKVLMLRYRRLIEYFAASGFAVGVSTPNQGFLTKPVLVGALTAGILVVLVGFLYRANGTIGAVAVTVLGLALAAGAGLLAMRHKKSRTE